MRRCNLESALFADGSFARGGGSDTMYATAEGQCFSEKEVLRLCGYHMVGGYYDPSLSPGFLVFGVQSFSDVQSLGVSKPGCFKPQFLIYGRFCAEALFCALLRSSTMKNRAPMVAINHQNVHTTYDIPEHRLT